MRCEEVMKTDVQSVRPNTPVAECARRMRDRNIGFLPVCDKDNKVLGTITDRDICIRVVAEGAPFDVPVERYMTAGNLAICQPREELKRAEQVMARNHVSRVLVCDEKEHLVGIISLSDVAQREQPGTASETMRQVSERETRSH